MQPKLWGIKTNINMHIEHSRYRVLQKERGISMGIKRLHDTHEATNWLYAAFSDNYFCHTFVSLPQKDHLGGTDDNG